MIQLQSSEVAIFMDRFAKGEFYSLRLGQAFHQQFKLEKVSTNRKAHDALYQQDGATIRSLFELI